MHEPDEILARRMLSKFLLEEDSSHLTVVSATAWSDSIPITGYFGNFLGRRLLSFVSLLPEPSF